MKKIITSALVLMMALTLTGCRKTAKKEEGSDVTILESEGNIEIIVPEDQESAGE